MQKELAKLQRMFPISHGEDMTDAVADFTVGAYATNLAFSANGRSIAVYCDDGRYSVLCDRDSEKRRIISFTRVVYLIDDYLGLGYYPHLAAI